MKFLALLTLVSAVCVVASPHSRHHKRRHHKKRQACGAAPEPIFSEVPVPDVPVDEAPVDEAPVDETPAPAPAPDVSGTLVLFEVDGVPGNECLTFRNNGEIVNAACVNEAADRQLTPTNLNGENVLVVQRAFSNGFRPDLVGQQVCVGFNGTHFKAEDCASNAVEFVSFTGGNMVASGGACLNGHDNLAQVTVDVNGQGCAEFIPTEVTPTPP